MRIFKNAWLVLLFFGSCTYDKASTEPCPLPGTVSFAQDIQPVFNQYCNTTDCHAGPAPGGNLNLESAVAYTQLHKQGSGYIDTITPRYSVLYAQMNSTSNPMPPDGKLDRCTQELVLKWIEQKAKNN